MSAHRILSGLGAAFYLHIKLAERALNAKTAAHQLASRGVFDAMRRTPCLRR